LSSRVVVGVVEIPPAAAAVLADLELEQRLLLRLEPITPLPLVAAVLAALQSLHIQMALKATIQYLALLHLLVVDTAQRFIAMVRLPFRVVPAVLAAVEQITMEPRQPHREALATLQALHRHKATTAAPH
jgi:hypothetical protein